MPAVIIRYRLDLKTIDGRRIGARVDPEKGKTAKIPVEERGAYYGPQDSLLIEDVFGFFVYQRYVPAESSPRLIATIGPRGSVESKPALAGGSLNRDALVFRTTDDYTDNKPYQPGDDPRRINWKLFSRYGELFVRESEKDPPPRAKYAVIVDGSVDPRLFNGEPGREAGRAAVDVLCACGLASALRFLERGFEVVFGSSGRPAVAGDSVAASRYFGGVSSFPLAESPPLSEIEDPSLRIVVFALPRLINGGSTIANHSLDRFVRGRSAISPPIDIHFISPIESVIGTKKLREAGSACATFYTKYGGADARSLET